MCALKEKSIECFDKDIPLESFNGNHLNNLLELSSDMKYLLESRLMTDITLWISDKYEMYCHKDILKFRSKWFYNAVCQADAKAVDVIEIDEDIHIMEAVLCYVYTGDLRLVESLNICLVEVYNAAEKYGFSRLEEILSCMLRESEYREIMKYAHFQWIVKVKDCDYQDVECPALNNFTICGDDKWLMKVNRMSSPNDDDYNIQVYLERQTEEPHTTIHNVNLTIHVMDCDGKCRHFISEKHDFHVDCEYALSKHIPLTKLMKQYDNLLSDGMLMLTCEVTFLAKVNFLTKFTLTGPYRRYNSNELVYLSEDMFNVFRDGRTHDISFSRCHVKIHYYILIVRSNIPKDFINELEKRAGFGKRLWTSFAAFLYTGQSRFLDEHVRTIYSALSDMVLTMARGKYSNLLVKNLTLENAFSILNDAVSYKDDSLSLAAANFLASKSGIESDPQIWIRVASDKTCMMKFVPQSYIFKQFL